MNFEDFFSLTSPSPNISLLSLYPINYKSIAIRWGNVLYTKRNIALGWSLINFHWLQVVFRNQILQIDYISVEFLKNELWLDDYIQPPIMHRTRRKQDMNLEVRLLYTLFQGTTMCYIPYKYIIRSVMIRKNTTIALKLQNMFRIILIHHHLLKYTNNLIEHTNLRYKIIRR